MTIPIGFEEFNLQNVNEKFKLKCFDENKELALISVPADFDVNCLKDQTLVTNGIIPLSSNNDGDDEDNIFQWEVHSHTAHHDKHINIILPSDTNGKHKLASSINMSVNVIRTVRVPTIKYPKKSKRKEMLPKPDNLRVRWEPFGSGVPVNSLKSTCDHTSTNKKEPLLSDIENSTKKKKKNKRRKSHENQVNQGKNTHKDTNGKQGQALVDKIVDEYESPIEKTKKKKKIHRHLKTNIEHNQEDVNKIDNSILQSSKTLNKKKKKKEKKERSHKDDILVNSNGRTEKKKHDERDSSDIDSATENRIFGITPTKTKKRKRNSLSNDGETEISSKKLKLKTESGERVKKTKKKK